ncbi:HNH endonuclease [Micromonospora carbonacea]|uniref:HNH endonuclease n=1 Tax=Micromonospora carbonacea TaxID=47853 RepID=UPI00340B150D
MTSPQVRAPQPAYRPPAWKIAEHWFDQGEFVIDLGEPACFACKWRDDRAPLHPSVSISDAWIRSKLERAHLVPHALGGSDYDLSNFVMLCQSCHKAAPDWRDPGVMLRWVRNRKHYLVVRYEEIVTTWESLWPGRPMPNPEAIDRAALSALLIKNAGTHAHRLKASTIVAALGQLDQ